MGKIPLGAAVGTILSLSQIRQLLSVNLSGTINYQQDPPHTASQTDLLEMCLLLPNLRDNLPESVSICWSVRSLKEDYTQYSKCWWLSGNCSQTNKSHNSHIISQKPISDRPLPFEL